MTTSGFRKTVARRGATDAFPLFLTAVPFAMVVGLAIVESGIPPLIGWSTSPIIFGGAAQLTLITLIGAGTGLVAAVGAALIIQTRHLLYSAAMAPTFQRQPRWFRWLGPFFLIDQMFAITVLRVGDDPEDFRSYYLGAMSVFFVGWISMTAVGILVGPQVPTSWNLGFAIPVMFVGLVVMGLDRWPKVAAAVAAGATTYLTIGLPNRSGMLVGGMVGIAVGYILSRGRA